MLKIEECLSPNLPHCGMLCDSKISKSLTKYPCIDEMWNKNSATAVIGKPGQGKSSWMYSLMASVLRKKFHNVFVFIPSASIHSMADPIYTTLPSDQVYDDLTEENLGYVLDRVKNEDKKFRSLIIFDDQSAHLKSNKEVLKMLKELLFNRRHYGVSIFFLVQTWYSIPREIRRSFSGLVLFKASKDEIRTIFDEVVEGKSKWRDQISDLVFTEPHKYLCVNLLNQNMFDGFNRIIFPDDNI